MKHRFENLYDSRKDKFYKSTANVYKSLGFIMIKHLGISYNLYYAIAGDAIYVEQIVED